MKSPYPYFGGKSTIMPEVWKRLGDPINFVDPFCGSQAPLLSRPGWDWSAGGWADGQNRIETVNDKDGYLANFWRAIAAAPEQVARWANWPVSELDLHARHRWLVENYDFIEHMRADPDYYDAKVAGWWVWGICSWIGSGWCKDLWEQRPHLGNLGQGIHRSTIDDLYAYFEALSKRLRRVRICCGDWTRVIGDTPTIHLGTTGVILDPPYSAEARRNNDLYATEDLTVAHDVRRWAIENGDNKKLRIVLFGYEDEHAAEIPADWETLAWEAQGGYGTRNANGYTNNSKERAWFSPHCLKVDKVRQLSFDIGGN